MTGVLFALLGWLVGGIPTADWLARAAGVDLRTSGSGNPGANNARRLGGARLGLGVLIAEIAKGASITLVGAAYGAAAAAGLGAVAGNILNPYRRLRGGQGLGISVGVLAVTWPVALAPALAFTALLVAVTRSAAQASVSTLAALAVAAYAWPAYSLPTAWGVEGATLAVLAAGLMASLAPKQIRNLAEASRRATGAQTGM
jgi:glycerol-3-phosphate acyltransferase PlsY